MTYVVVKQGVYLHDVLGPFTTKRGAKAAAQVAAAEDSDDYHEWNVMTIDQVGGLGDICASYRKYCPRGGQGLWWNDLRTELLARKETWS